MHKSIKVLILVLIAIGIIAFLGPFYIVSEGEQAVVTFLGKIVRTEVHAGLKYKWPFVEKVSLYSNMILSWDGEPQRLPTSEKQFIWVDTTARWKIKDPAKFYESVTSMDRADARLNDVIDSAVRTIIAQNSLVESVRSSDQIITSSAQDQEAQRLMDKEAEGLNLSFTTEASFPQIKVGREKVSDQILARARMTVPQYGIELIDVVIRQIRYSDDLTQSVYDRMITERNQRARAYRSSGEGQKLDWLGKLDKEKKTILSEAYAKSQEIKGQADAEATRIYAEAFGKNRQFYNFWKSMESYENTLPMLDKTLTTDLDYFRYLYNAGGRQ